ncbi:30S ribosomal protein S12 methylthiotransferase RimO [Candidatus Marithrix sp. Canyon 246]|uniref:30S ribosomal protein S12 methylthiotransferase RimO n=1 Tax=Candidatus Marithrix sp. Canyon 246 TaxID=1827136 RepID=UPI00084A0A02|nr:30S ribosomal protein S12 methylthiotransferase RimO [Candidatus Marithrix sp. Canyon 246]
MNIGFISLGCPKATVDSERILTQLRAEGYAISPNYNDAELVVVNTCGFINEAVEESLEVIGEALAENGKVIVTGCLGARGDLVKKTFPELLAVTGPNSVDEVMTAIHTELPPEHDPYIDLVPPGGIKLTPRHYAYLKIAEGCNQKCSFCIIPSLRGRLVSRPIGDILDEAEKLVSAGVRELLIVSQDTAAYGVDTKYRLDFWQGKPLKTRITELVRNLATLGAWLRLHYIYPYPHVDQLVELMADGLVLPYLDVPLQHGSPKILKAMRRPANSENMLARIANWREICPDITLRSTFIVGFPGETEQEFETLLDFIQQARLDRVGAFAYSAVEGATANQLAGAIPEELKQERLNRFMEMQSQISAEKLQQKIGQKITVIVDEITDTEIYARSAAEAPEIDGLIIIEKTKDLLPGALVDVRITDADEHDLYSKIENS